MRYIRRNIQIIDHQTGQTLDFPTFAKEPCQDQITRIEQNVNDKINNLAALVGSPLKANTVSQMTDSDKIYVYTGSESGYQQGHWYYNDGNGWVDGGAYNSAAIDTDATLSISGKASDAKTVGDYISSVNGEHLNLTFVRGYINASGVLTASGSYDTVTTNSFMPLNGIVEIFADVNNVEMYLSVYQANGTFIGFAQWDAYTYTSIKWGVICGLPFNSKQGLKGKITIRHADQSSISSLSEFSNALYAKYGGNLATEELTNDEGYNCFYDGRFMTGNLDTDGSYYADSDRITTSKYYKFSYDIVITTDRGLVVCTYNNNKQLSSRTYYSANSTIHVPSNKYFRFSVADCTSAGGSAENIKNIKYSTYQKKTVTRLEDSAFDFMRCFKKFVGVGDSLMAGYTQDSSHTVNSATARAQKNNWFEYLISRLNRDGTNLAVGSSTAENWRYVNQSGTTDSDIEKANINGTDCYLVGIGVNDVRQSKTVGTSADIASSYTNNQNSFYGNYDYIVRKMKSFRPYAKIFCFKIPSSESNSADYNQAISYIASLYDNVYAIDLENTVSFADDPLIVGGFDHNHYNPVVYNYISTIIEGSINRYIANNMSEFRWIPYEY